jgi:hypothetical protein
VSRGDEIRLALLPDRLHALDPATEPTLELPERERGRTAAVLRL